MAWVPVNRSVFTHRKTMKMADLLDIPEVYAVAHLTALWTWAMDNAPSGMIPAGTSARMIARAAEYPGNVQAFLEALMESEYLVLTEEGYELPNWMEYGGKLVTQQAKNAEKQLRYREKKESSKNVTDALPLRNGNSDDSVPSELPSREEERREENIPLTPKGEMTTEKVFSFHDPLPLHVENFLKESCPDWWEDHLRLALVGRSPSGLASYALEILRGYKRGGERAPQAPLPKTQSSVAPPPESMPIPSLQDLRARRRAALSAPLGGSDAPQ